MSSTDFSPLWSGVEKLGLHLDNQQRQALQRYHNELVLWNSRLGLVKAEGESLLRKHFLDSLAAVPLLTELQRSTGFSTAADLGSGNGFPGVVLAIAMPDIAFSLVERSGKRCGFLRNVAALLPKYRLQIQQCDLAQLQNSYGLVTSRAFRPLQPGIVAGMRQITATPGVWALYKGDPAAAADELQLAGLQGAIHPLAVPGVSEQRCLAVCRW